MKDNRFTITISAVPVHGSGDAIRLRLAMTRSTSPTSPPPPAFTSRTTPAAAGKKWLPETMGPGCAFFDADGDGWLDILLINGKDWIPRGRHTTAALYRNNHDGTFTDITKGSGLDIEIYGMGVSHRRLR